MKIFWLIVLAGLAYGGKYLYDMGYFDSVIGSFDHTVANTSDFVTDKAVKKADFN